MLYLLSEQITKFQSICSPIHIAANPKGFVEIPNVAENIENADLQELGHRYKIRADILKKCRTKKNIKYNEINMSNIDVTALCCSYICGQDVSSYSRW